MDRPLKGLSRALAVAIVGLAGWLTVTEVREAFGEGPPYYGRTTNLDKWSDPRPRLLALDGAALLVAAGLVFLARRQP